MSIPEKRKMNKKRSQKKVMENKNKSTIKGEIFRAVLISAIFISIIFIIGSGCNIYKRNIQYSEEILREHSISVATKVTHYFRDIHAVLDILTYSPTVNTVYNDEDHKKELLKTLSLIEAGASRINNFIVVYQDGTVISNNENLQAECNHQNSKWYLEAIQEEANKIVFEYIPSENEVVKPKLFISKAFSLDGKINGVIAVDCKIDSLLSLTSPILMYPSNKIIMASKEENQIIGKNLSIIDTLLFTENIELLNNEHQILTTRIENQKLMFISKEIAETGWFVISRINFSDLTPYIIPRILTILFLFLSVASIAIIILSKILGRKFAQPVIEVSKSLQRLAEGDKSVEAIDNNSQNEIGKMAESFNIFLNTTKILKSDITELQESKENLSYMISLLDASLESTNDGVLILDNDLNIVKINKVFSKCLGIPQEHSGNKTLKFELINYNHMFVDFNSFLKTVLEVNEHPEMSSFNISELTNGLIIEFYSFPQKIENEVVGRVWRIHDVTASRKLEDQLKVNEENFRMYFESMQDITFITDLKGHIKHVNKGAQDKLGYSYEELITMTILDLHDRSVKLSLPEIMGYLIADKGADCTIPVMTKEGRMIGVETKTWLGKWNGEEALFGITKDVSKEQEALLKFNKIFDNNPALMSLSSYPERKYIDVNDSFCKILGYSKDEIIGKTVEELHLVMELGALDDATVGLISEGNFTNIQINVITKSNSIIEGLFSGELIEMVGKKFYLTVMTDISDMMRLDRNLRKSESKYRLLFENMTTGFALHEMIFDEDNKPIDYRFLDVNPAFEQFTGLKAKDVIGNRVKYILPNTEDYWVETYGDVVKTKQSISYEQYSQELDKYFEVKAFSQNQNNFATIFSDVTSRVKAVKELENEKKIAQKATKAKSEFLANMSHEIRTPLNGVIGFTDLLLSTELSSAQKQFSINANISGKALLGIINDILDFSKIEAGKMELELVSSSIIDILEQALDIVKFSAYKKGVELILNTPPDFPEKALVDPLRLKQILLNLLNNAVKFTQKGEIELSVKFLPNNQKIGSFTFSVKDTGIGISDSASKKLFHAFSQADNSITRKYGGTGLGLVISNSFASLMGSKIDFMSNDGAGSEFYFTITTEYLMNLKSRKAQMNGHKILFADKNSRFRDIMKDKMDYWGLEVDLADSKTQIIENINTSYYKVLLIDERLLTIDDYQQIDDVLVKSKMNDSKTYTILTSCPNDNIEVVKLYNKYDISYILPKPLVDDVLFSKIDKLCCSGDVPDFEEKSTPKTIAKINQSKKLKVLIAEDVEMNMILIKTLVKKIIPSVEILKAKNGKEAIQLYKDNLPELILMDVQMPELDGLEATKEIKSIENITDLNTPIIALTAGAFIGDRENCLNAGMVDFLTKPIDVKELTKILTKYL